ncbi:MAG: PhoH family protein [Hyphomonadaceae bacterium]|nr:MAG: phosphate starvation-inducible protein PhoH [Caulobacteraceae bacterium]MBT9444439.1 PhoH family protein [Hyphomonadaceae bacterium]TPW06391.1 MAG: phosphate starvation-inducible protein PhoH [Alphaproteobacteria bacterium]
MNRTIAISDANAAKAIFGPLHRHVALIQDSFRTGETHSVDVHVSGNEVTLTSDDAGELARAEGIFATLIRHFDMRKKLREAEVRAAISFSTPNADGEIELRDLPTLGTFTLQTPRQQRYVQAMRSEDKPLVFGVGPAGTGKTFLAVTAAVEALRNGLVDKIIVTRPAVEAGERLGFLPGALEEKVDPYLQPIWDAFRSQMRDEELKQRREQNKIEVAPIAFMRGRTLTNAFVIVDEAQNATIQQMKMVLTRLGQGSQMVVTGDPSQIDLPNARMSGLDHALAILADKRRIEVVRFTSQDVMRHDLVAEIVEAYEADERAHRQSA